MVETDGKGDGRRYPLSFRTTFDLQQGLKDAAAANGRSLAQEVEIRLERSLEEDRRPNDQPRWVRMLLKRLGLALTVFDEITEKEVVDSEAFGVASEYLAKQIIDSFYQTKDLTALTEDERDMVGPLMSKAVSIFDMIAKPSALPRNKLLDAADPVYSRLNPANLK